MSDCSESKAVSDSSSDEESIRTGYEDYTPKARRRVVRRKYKKVLMRAVRRQILINSYRRSLIKQFKVTYDMLMALDNDGDANDSDDQTANNLAQQNTRINKRLDEILFTRLQELEILDEIQIVANRVAKGDKDLD